jgi:hypothetical protein
MATIGVGPPLAVGQAPRCGIGLYLPEAIAFYHIPMRESRDISVALTFAQYYGIMGLLL